MTINNKQYLDCPECPKCKPKDTLRNGVKWGICGMGGNIVYLEPWKEKKEEAEVDIFIITFPVVDYLRKKEDWNE